jgi:hypothetical protein
VLKSSVIARASGQVRRLSLESWWTAVHIRRPQGDLD